VPALADIDFTDLDNFAAGFPHRLFEIHRREAPVWWHEPTEHTPDGEGFWSVATYAEALEVLRDPETYASERGLLALAQHPGQYQQLRAEPALLPTAVEEIVRWTTPSPAKRRTATRDTMLGGAQIAAGDKVVIWEGSANRDDAAFDRPERFDVTRNPNPHLGFGHGVHFCLGAGLARLEMLVMFEELLSQFANVRVVEPVEWTRSNRHTGIRRLIVELSRSP
jgi:cytochrome P450